MSDEAAKAYEERQREPLFKSARGMIPMEEVRQHYANLICGYNKRDGCKLQVRDKSLYACMYHQAIQAIGTEFFLYYNMMTETELYEMSPEQHDKLEARHRYMTKWLDNFPRGANPD